MSDNAIPMVNSPASKNTRGSSYRAFSLLFILVCSCCFLFFFILHKSFLRYDGLVQHLTALTYWGEYLRTFFIALFKKGEIIVPQFDFSIGYGADILTTIHYYTIGDPLNLIAAIVPASKTETLYDVLVVIRLYLSGVSFLAFCRHHKLEKWSSIAGSFIYIFSGYSLYCAVRHPFFINPMICLPLVFLGFDKVLKRDNPLPFILSVFLSCITSFYFFYMLTILIAIYGVIRFFASSRDERPVKAIRVVAILLLCYILGTAMAAVVFLPNVLGFLNSSRSGDTAIVPIFYDMVYYGKAVFSILSPERFGAYSFFGFTALGFSACILCILRKDTISKQLKIGLAVLLLCMALPVFGHIFNGFNYVTNRWCFAFSFLAALTTAYLLPQFPSMTRKEFVLCTMIPASLCLFVIIGSLFSRLVAAEFLLAHSVALLVLLLFSTAYMLQPNMADAKTKRNSCIFFLVCTLTSVVINAAIRYSPAQYNYLEDFYDYGKAHSMYTSEIDSYIKEATSDGDFYRYDEPQKILKNNAMLFGTHSTAFYWSLSNSNVSKALNMLGASSQYWQSTGFDARAIPNALMCVKYVVLKKDSENILSPAFVKKATVRGYDVYENQNPLPFGYTYDAYLSDSLFERLTCAERQSVLLDYAIIPGAPFVDKQESVEGFPIMYPKYEVVAEGRNAVAANKLIIKDTDSKIVVHFTSIPNTETYLSIEGIFHADKAIKPTMVITDEFGKVQQVEIANYEHYYGHDYLINLGYHESAIHSVALQFDKKGAYAYRNLRIECMSLDGVDKKIDRLKKNSLQNVQFSVNSISGTISTAESKLLCLSLPYSKGWKAYVDGNEVPLYRMQIMLTGIFLDPGVHVVKLVYRTPGLLAGAILTTAAMLVFIFLCVVFLRRKRI